MKIRPVGAELFRADGQRDRRTDERMDGRMDGRTGGRTDGRTDGHRDVKMLIVSFRSLANDPKTEMYLHIKQTKANALNYKRLKIAA